MQCPTKDVWADVMTENFLETKQKKKNDIVRNVNQSYVMLLGNNAWLKCTIMAVTTREISLEC